MPSAVTVTINPFKVACLVIVILAGILAWQNFFDHDRPGAAEVQLYKDSADYWKKVANDYGVKAAEDLNEYIALRRQFDFQMLEIEAIPIKYVPIRENIMRLNADQSIRLLSERLSVSDSSGR